MIGLCAFFGCFFAIAFHRGSSGLTYLPTTSSRCDDVVGTVRACIEGITRFRIRREMDSPQVGKQPIHNWRKRFAKISDEHERQRKRLSMNLTQFFVGITGSNELLG